MKPHCRGYRLCVFQVSRRHRSEFWLVHAAQRWAKISNIRYIVVGNRLLLLVVDWLAPIMSSCNHSADSHKLSEQLSVRGMSLGKNASTFWIARATPVTASISTEAQGASHQSDLYAYNFLPLITSFSTILKPFQSSSFLCRKYLWSRDLPSASASAVVIYTTTKCIITSGLTSQRV